MIVIMLGVFISYHALGWLSFINDYHAVDCHPALDDYQLSCLGMVIVIKHRDEYHAWGLLSVIMHRDGYHAGDCYHAWDGYHLSC